MKLDLNKQKALKCSKQALGTLKKVIVMIEKNEYCPDILQQSKSVIGLLQLMKKHLLKGHLNGCLSQKMMEDREKAIGELIKILNLND